jgi:hypothetical protein
LSVYSSTLVKFHLQISVHHIRFISSSKPSREVLATSLPSDQPPMASLTSLRQII